jgi:hypothetical protein
MLALLGLTAVVAAAAEQGTLSSPAQVVSWEYDQIHPRAAYSPSAAKYLVVWEDHHWGWGDEWDIYGRFVSAAGVPQGGIFGVGWEYENHMMAPAVACNSTTGEFLVVWEFAYSDVDHDIWGRLVAGDGTLISDWLDVATSSNNEYAPAVCYNPDLNEYLIVYERRSGADPVTPRDLVCTRLGAAGEQIATADVIATTADECQPDITYGFHSDKYIVVYRTPNATWTDLNIHACLLSGDGTPAGAPFSANWQPGHDQNPTVAFDSENNEFFVMSANGSGAARELKGEYFDAETGAHLNGASLVQNDAEGPQKHLHTVLLGEPAGRRV